MPVDPRSLAVVGAQAGDAIRIFDLEQSVRKLRELRTEYDAKGNGSCSSISFSPNGTRLAATYRRGRESVMLWDMKGNPPFCQLLEGSQNNQHGGAFSPDSACFVAFGFDPENVQLWDARTGKLLGNLLGHTDQIFAGSFVPRTDFVVTGSIDNTIRIWDAATFQQRSVFHGHRDSISSIAVAPDGRTAASGSRDGTIKLWRPEPTSEDDCRRSFPPGVVTVAVSGRGHHVVNRSRNEKGEWHGDVEVWETKTLQLCHRIPAAGEHQCVAVTEDGKFVAISYVDGKLELIQTGDSHPRQLLDSMAHPFSDLRFWPDGSRLAGPYDDGTVFVWEVASGCRVDHLKDRAAPSPKTRRSLAISPNGQYLAVHAPESSDYSFLGGPGDQFVGFLRLVTFIQAAQRPLGLCNGSRVFARLEMVVFNQLGWYLASVGPERRQCKYEVSRGAR